MGGFRRHVQTYSFWLVGCGRSLAVASYRIVAMILSKAAMFRYIVYTHTQTVWLPRKYEVAFAARELLFPAMA